MELGRSRFIIRSILYRCNSTLWRKKRPAPRSVTLESISEHITNAFKQKNADEILAAYDMVVSSSGRSKVQLKLPDIQAILWACSAVDPSKGSNGSKVLKALDIYENIKKTEILPSMSFHHLMNVCAKFGQGTAAVGMMADYKALKYEITPGLLGDFIITMSKHLRRINTSARSSAAIESDLKQAYQQYLSMLSNKHKGSVEIHDSSNNAPIGVHNSKNTFMQLATAYSVLGRQENVLQVVKDMIDIGNHAPTVEFSNELLEHSLFEGDVNTLAVLSNWYLENFDFQLPLGCLVKMLHIGSGAGSPLLTRNCVQLLRKYGYKPTAAHYAAWLHGSLLAEDMQSALESLVDAESSGVRLEAEREGIDIALLQEMFANFVSSRLIVLEELYETLVEFTHKGIKVPPIALNAIIAASGFINDLDRGFAIIQEYSSKFRLSLDVHAYNALLCAVARSADKGFMKTVLLILERMESEGIQPNSVSFSYLCDVMVDSAHYHSLNEILDHSKKVGQHPSQKSLRRLCVALTAHPVHYPLAETVVELIDKDPDTGKLPNFLLKRLAFVEEKRKARRISEK